MGRGVLFTPLCGAIISDSDLYGHLPTATSGLFYRRQAGKATNLPPNLIHIMKNYVLVIKEEEQ